VKVPTLQTEQLVADFAALAYNPLGHTPHSVLFEYEVYQPAGQDIQNVMSFRAA
jgi:hypothetical protein